MYNLYTLYMYMIIEHVVIHAHVHMYHTQYLIMAMHHKTTTSTHNQQCLI